MNPSLSPLKMSVVTALFVLGLGGTVAAGEQSAPGTENGRYALSQGNDGIIRLDTRTGTVSNCNNSAGGWACYAMPDERKAMDEEIGRLQAENEKLKAQLASASAGKTDDALPKSDKQDAPKAAQGERQGERKIEIPLPSDQDVDRVISFLERAWQRLVDMANRMQKDASGKI